MDTNTLKKFAQAARRQLMAAVATRLEQVLRTDSAEIREKEAVVSKLQQAIKESSHDQVIESAAYTWFNRLCALRFMDVNHYTTVGVVSPLEGFTQPEILQEAKKGLVDSEFGKVDKPRVFGLLNGQIPSANPQQEAYRWLLVGTCNSYYERMPFLFPQIDDYTALLMPADLLSDESILASIRETLTADTCKDVEVIGWLYQFYISEKKDEVMARKSAVPKEDIPAVTQLFTPHWIVRYLVENSLGRLWMLNHPDSNLVDRMEYFIKLDQPETDYIKINNPDEIKICDPACGSGHMLTYAFDLLYAIYEEQGYDQIHIPSLIIQNNLFGIEIDERAGQLAAFALMMKAREKDKRFFTRKINPNICVMEDVSFSTGEVKTYMDKVGSDLFTQELWFGLQQFEDAKTFGSLIRPQIHDPQGVLRRMKEQGAFENLFLFETNRKVKKVLEMVEYLNPRYQVVFTNPPYLSKGMNEDLKRFAKDQYPRGKGDTFAMFIERNLDMSLPQGYVGMITLMSWMFLSSFEKLRIRLINEKSIINLAHLGARAFDTIGGEVVSTTMFTLQNSFRPNYKGGYFRLVDCTSEKEKSKALKEAITNTNCGWFYRVSAQDFEKIPGAPIAYWVSDKTRRIFKLSTDIDGIANVMKGLDTCNNERFLRFWYEIAKDKFYFFSKEISCKWHPYLKGGPFRKWGGNNEYVVNWKNYGEEIKNYRNPDGSIKSRPQNIDYYYKEGITFSALTSTSPLSCRFMKHSIFGGGGNGVFIKKGNQKVLTKSLLGLLNSKSANYIMQILNPTLNYLVGDIKKIPFVQVEKEVPNLVEELINHSLNDWDSYESSWEFSQNPIVEIIQKSGESQIKEIYKILRNNWQQMTIETKLLEEKNNQIFAHSFGFQDELVPDVSLEKVTLNCNPHYRYGGKKSKDDLEAFLLSDTMKEFVSYTVGCMFGRYSLDKPGLILANQGDTLQDYLNQVPQPRFMPDKDNALPILEGEWFADDIVSRFREFLKTTFGEEHFEENLTFLENAIGKNIRSYFLRDFYNEHVKMYKKRPIYWLFSSSKGSFNAMIYMHRYQKDTVSIILNDYLIPYREKLSARKSHLQVVSQNGNAGSSEKNRALKEINQINAVLLELRDYEDEILYPLARERVKIDLDDGVKVNYAKFGRALKYVSGLSDQS